MRGPGEDEKPLPIVIFEDTGKAELAPDAGGIWATVPWFGIGNPLECAPWYPREITSGPLKGLASLKSRGLQMREGSWGNEEIQKSVQQRKIE